MYQPRVEAQEQFALKVSIGANVLFTVLGFGFAVLTRSQAVLLDGVFSLSSCIMAVLTLIIAQIVQRPDDDTFHFGYAHFEPLLNVFKALLIVAIAAFALVSAIDALFHGGRAFATGPALVYATLMTLLCTPRLAPVTHRWSLWMRKTGPLTLSSAAPSVWRSSSYWSWNAPPGLPTWSTLIQPWSPSWCSSSSLYHSGSSRTICGKHS